jgi:hypothetical protein
LRFLGLSSGMHCDQQTAANMLHRLIGRLRC